MNLFDPYSIDENRLLLASHLPTGRVWQRGFSPDSNIGLYFTALAAEFYRMEVLCSEVVKEMDVNLTDKLLIEWEKSMGIPDSCFSGRVFGSRKTQILQKLSNFGGVQTAQEFENVAAAFGITASVFAGKIGGGLTFPLSWPVIFTPYENSVEQSHTIIIAITGIYPSDNTFALNFPIPFSTGPQSFLQCIFRKLAPANVNVVVLYSEDL